MTSQPVSPTPSLWAHFRFSIVGSLLSAPAPHGGLRTALQDLADKTWTHPVNGRPVQFAASTIERWYYAARGAKHDPIRVLRKAVRKDCGQISLPAVQPGDPEARSAPLDDDRRRLGDDRRGVPRRAAEPGDRPRDDPALFAVPKREARTFLGDPGRPADGDAGGREGADAGVPQRSHPGLGRDGVQPGRAPGVGLFAGRTVRQDARRAASQSTWPRRGSSPYC